MEDPVPVLLLLCVTCLIVLAVMLFLSDCDLQLKWAEKFGHSTGSLKDQVVWITGASSGIGESLAYKLAAIGCRLVLTARREDRLLQIKQNIIDHGYLTEENILLVPIDLLQFSSHSDAVQTVLQHFDKIDILVNNAGRSQRSLIERCPLEVDKQVIDINTLSPISLTKAVLPHFIKRRAGHIVFTSSIAGKIGSPGLGSYACSKHALQGWLDTLRIEMYTYNTCVTSVCPGPVFSEALVHAFTDKVDKTLGVTMDPKERRMTAERCATLMSVAMANRLDEVWVSPHPELFYLYLFQYFPSIAKRIAKVFGQERVTKVKTGSRSLHKTS
uniref:Dehydrogenase/reductase SDR family member 7-like n=1 Tax=Crassostrea virginica TaxID=6565 RepID=A0A8B8E617_CRAVI|nr:dehydrogenase/reductase SDR family member 7-like [Crassostrea virginica]XP_022335140.1 dehydrogenase/reductase SDR family member 7-like [Crassostrea virginica]